jgi:hypothetical protein
MPFLSLIFCVPYYIFSIVLRRKVGHLDLISLFFIIVETQQSLTAYLSQFYHNLITFKATCFGLQVAIIRPI